MSIIKVIPVSDPGNRLVAGAAMRVRVVGDPGNRLAAGRIIQVYAVSESERSIQAGEPIEVYQVSEGSSLVSSTPVYPVYVVEGAFSGGAEPPGAPTNLTATPISTTEIDLAWDDNSSDEIGFNIYRDAVLIDSVAADITAYSDTGLVASTSYDYYVTAFNGFGESSPSNIASATTDGGFTCGDIISNYTIQVDEDEVCIGTVTVFSGVTLTILGSLTIN